MIARSFRIAGIGLLAIAALAQQKTAPVIQAEKWKISGVVVDATSGTPLAQALVAITPAGKQNESRTKVVDEDGRFVFDNLDAGKYSLLAERKGYLREAFDQHGQYSTSIVVGPKLKSEDLLFRLHRDASISGAITDDQNEPVRRADVMLFEEATYNGRTNLRARANSNDEGVYRFTHLSPGKYFVAVSSEPWYAVRPDVRPFRVANPRIEGQPITDQQSSVTSQEENPSSEQPSSSPLDVAYPITFYSAATEFEAATPIMLATGEKFTADLNLHAVPALHLRVTSSTPNQNPNIAVEARPVGQFTIGVRARSMPIGGGVTEVSGVAPGNYILRVNSYDGKNWSSSSKEVSISADARVSTDEKDAHIPVSGVVKLEQGGSLSGQTNIWLVDKSSGTRYWGQVSNKNEFEVERGVPAGRYQVQVSTTGLYFKDLGATGGRVTGHTVEIGSGAAVKLTVVLSPGLAQVDGIALKDDTPAAGVLVLMVPEEAAANPQLFRLDQSDSDGTFSIASAVPGKYTLVAIENGWSLQWINPKIIKPYLAQGVPIQVEPKGKYEIKVKVQTTRSK
ncbi:MAG TPA: carboxypeptidase-like regulatory domain-containing protein [Candidatus Angelobacter sp.]|nr:carboxypeptidase-like regulatory domain-containing protein [Candidatus Angelobacter sp.]